MLSRRHIRVVVTRTLDIHGDPLTMVMAVQSALEREKSEPTRVEIVAHDVFDEEDEDDDR